MIDRIRQIGERLVGYSWWQVGIELAVIGIVVYLFVRFVASARAPRSVKLAFYLFLVATLLIRVLGARESFQRVGFLYDSVLPVVILALLVIFQPELRRAMMRAGDFSFLRRRIEPETRAVEEIVKAAKYLSRAKFGAIMVVERETSLRNMLEGGTVLNAEVSAPLLQTIFFPGSALHDLAVVIKGDRILAAGVQLPLAEATEMEDASLGSRHRAAVGVSAESDAVVVVVSEETGLISLAERGELTRGLNEDELRSLLILKYNRGLVTELTTGEAAPEPSPRESNPAMGETTFGDEPVLEGQRR